MSAGGDTPGTGRPCSVASAFSAVDNSKRVRDQRQQMLLSACTFLEQLELDGAAEGLLWVVAGDARAVGHTVLERIGKISLSHVRREVGDVEDGLKQVWMRPWCVVVLWLQIVGHLSVRCAGDLLWVVLLVRAARCASCCVVRSREGGGTGGERDVGSVVDDDGASFRQKTQSVWPQHTHVL